MIQKARHSTSRSDEVKARKAAEIEEKILIYLQQALDIRDQAVQTLNAAKDKGAIPIDVARLIEFIGYLETLEEQIYRRTCRHEKIPHHEKWFSLFEPHTEWISKGKMHKQVELGHNLAVATDQYHLVIDFEIMFKTSDAAVGLEMGQRIIKNYGAYHTVISMSFDRGYYSALAKKALSKNVDQLIMPKRGKKTLAQQEEENAEDYQKLRRAHSAVESNINQLEHNGLDRCADKGPKAFRRYIALGIVSYNLHRLGRMLIHDEKAENEKKKGNKAA